MRTLLFLLMAAPLLAQPDPGSAFVDMGGDVIPSYSATSHGLVLDYTTQYSWSITRAANGDKVFTFSAKECVYYTAAQVPLTGIYIWVALPQPICTPLSQSAAQTLGPIAAALTEFYDYHPNAPHLPPVYNPSAAQPQPRPLAVGPVRAELTTVQPLTPPNPQMFLLDGLTYNALKFDLGTQQVVSQVVVPSTSGPLGIRPTATGPQREVWVANGGLEVTVVDFTTQSVVTNILTPSVPQACVPVGIVFTNDGSTALEAFQFFSPDSTGNSGALVAFDAVNRKVTSTLLLKNGPSALVMAPDGLTAYLLSNNGQITYYDVLSGTADLSVSTFTPGLAGGYPGSSANVFAHPDGTRLFWNVNTLLVAFDLNTHKIAYQLSSGLPTTSPVSMQMAQDGSTIWLTSAAGTVAVYDVRSGIIFGTFTSDAASAVYPGPGN